MEEFSDIRKWCQANTPKCLPILNDTIRNRPEWMREDMKRAQNAAKIEVREFFRSLGL